MGKISIGATRRRVTLKEREAEAKKMAEDVQGTLSGREMTVSEAAALHAQQSGVVIRRTTVAE